jgi:hypothetical protein
MREREKSVTGGLIVGSALACSDVQTLTFRPPFRIIYKTRKWICHSLASVARGICRLVTCTQPGAPFDAEEPYCNRAGGLAIRMPLEDLGGLAWRV